MVQRLANKFSRMGGLLNSWGHAFGSLPVDYCCFDIETIPVGSSLHIVRQIGYCVVRNKKVYKRHSDRLAWEECLNKDKSEQYTALAKKIDSRKWHLDEGKDPKEVLLNFNNVVKSNPVLVSYNGWAFDVPILEKEYKSFDLILGIKDSQMIDAGAIVKSSQTGVFPRRGDTYKSFTERSIHKGDRKTKWSLHNFWVANVQPFIKESEEFHDAKTDSYLTHLVIEWFRNTHAKN